MAKHRVKFRKMRVRARVRRKGAKGEGRWEEIDAEGYDAADAAERKIRWFNDTCRPGEPEREVVEVGSLEDDRPARHEWRKTSLVTESVRGSIGFFDRYACVNCGATGKRHGLDDHIVPDRKFHGLECREVMDKAARKRKRR